MNWLKHISSRIQEMQEAATHSYCLGDFESYGVLKKELETGAKLLRYLESEIKTSGDENKEA